MAKSSNLYLIPPGSPSASFSGGSGGDGGDMNGGPTWKDLIDAGDEKTRAQNDARFSEIVGGLTALGDRLDMQKELLVQTKISADRAEIAADAAKSAVNNVKWNILFTAIAVIGIIFVTWQLWMQGIEMTTAILSN